MVKPWPSKPMIRVRSPVAAPVHAKPGPTIGPGFSLGYDWPSPNRAKTMTELEEAIQDLELEAAEEAALDDGVDE